MYGNTTSAAAIGGTGIIAATTGWTVAGWCLLGVAVITAGALTAGRLRRNRG